MNRKAYIMLIFLVLLPLCSSGQETAASDQRPRFVDRDGDGLNDLAPDRDRDGIPDRLDSDIGNSQLKRRWQWRLYRNMPDSAGVDSTHFRDWWQRSGHPPPWHEGWERWRDLNRHHRPGSSPFDDRFIPHPYDPRFGPRHPRPEQPEPGGPGWDNGNGEGNGP